MDDYSHKLQARTGLEMLKAAVLKVLSHDVGMKRHEIIKALGFCLSGGAGKSGEVMTGVLRLLEEENMRNAALIENGIGARSHRGASLEIYP